MLINTENVLHYALLHSQLLLKLSLTKRVNGHFVYSSIFQLSNTIYYP